MNQEVNSFSAHICLIHVCSHWWSIQWRPRRAGIRAKPECYGKLRVSRNWEWQLLSSVLSQNPFSPLKCKDVEVSFAAPILHFENRCFSSPSYLLCCNKKKISFILDTNSNWQLPACRFIASDVTVRRWILFTYLSQENVAQQEVLLSQKEWVVVVAQQRSYCKVMFMAAPAAELPSGQSLSNNVFQAATVYSAEMLDGGQTPRSYRCPQFVLLPSLRSLSQTSPAVKTCRTSHTLAQVGALRHDLSKDIEKVELSWQSFSFTWTLFGFA